MPPAKKDDDAVRITLRLPEAVHDALVQVAKKDRRSLNAEIVHLLEQALQTQED